MEQSRALRLMVVWPERASGEYRQDPEENNVQFFERVQGVAGKHHKRGGSLQGRLVGFMTRESWQRYCAAREVSLADKRMGQPYKHLPRSEFAMKVRGTDLVRVDLTITGIAAMGRSIPFFNSEKF